MVSAKRGNPPLNNYPWTRLSVRIIGVIKTQFFHMVMYVFDNGNLFVIDTWGAVICSLGHGRKHMLTILPTIWRPGLKADFVSSQKPLAASQQLLASSQNNFLSSPEYDNLMNIGLAGLSNRGS